MPPTLSAKEKNRSWDTQRQTIAAVNQHRKIKDFSEAARQAGFDSIADVLIEDMDKSRDGAIHYRRNLLAHTRFKALVCDLARDIVGHEITQVVARAKMRLPANNVTPKTIE